MALRCARHLIYTLLADLALLTDVDRLRRMHDLDPSALQHTRRMLSAPGLLRVQANAFSTSLYINRGGGEFEASE